MRVFILMIMVCYCEASVNVTSEKPLEVGNFVLERSENFEQFVHKVFEPTSTKSVKFLTTNRSTVNVKLSGNTYTEIYTVGNQVISNSFQLGIEFEEDTFFGPITTVAHKDYTPPFTEFTWSSKLPNNKRFTRKFYMLANGFTVVMTSPNINVTAILHYKRI
ncbi:hypothetical protein HCN44_008442 [Aphidius gifuensis]|uniref:Venom protein n=1 Tax=Aphidius gifuensis TaxID=684658 RepID=A0A834XNQ1_APHGI|nr:hypothetical protein HCN44_008442 [Aphidius gifuensis]